MGKDIADVTDPATNIKTDEKKQHFDDIYIATDPVPYKERILDKLEYVSDDFNRGMFDRLILPWIQSLPSGTTLNYVDLAGCFGNTTMACVNGMTYAEIKHNWRDSNACQAVDKPRRFQCHTANIDISTNAVAYSTGVGIFDEGIVADLNTGAERAAVDRAMSTADIIISTAALVYLDLHAIDQLVRTFATGGGNNTGTTGTGYMLVNFLNPFSLEKADATKQILLQHLEFCGSTATRHRRMSELEQNNYPGETWVLLELWVLRRRPRNK